MPGLVGLAPSFHIFIGSMASNSIKLSISYPCYQPSKVVIVKTNGDKRAVIMHSATCNLHEDTGRLEESSFPSCPSSYPPVFHCHQRSHN